MTINMTSEEKLKRKRESQKRWRERNREKDTARKIKWARDNRERFNEICRKSRNKLRKEVLEHYSKGKMVCKCCNEDAIEFLAIDHIEGGGNKHRKSISKSNSPNTSIYQWLRKNKYPIGFQVLCHNCNMAKSLYGECPHSKQTLTVKILEI